MSVLYKNLKITDHTGTKEGSVLIEDGKISKIIPSGEDLPEAAQIIDTRGLTMMPGFIDMHAHLRDPGLTYKEDLETGLSSAAKGGFTTVVAMANTNPITDTREKKEKIENRAKDLGLSDLIQVVAVTKDFGEKVVDFDSLEGSVKVLSNDGVDINSTEIIREALSWARNHPGVIVATHNEPEFVSITQDLGENYYTKGPLHFCHVSERRSMDLIREFKKINPEICTVEVTPHHLYKTGFDYKVKPPIREEEDRLAMIEAIKDGLVDVLSTDHAPHSQEDKEKGAVGMIGFETAFGILNKVFRDNNIPLEKLSKLNSYNPAKILNIPGGEIKENAPATFVLVDPDEAWEFREEDIVSKSKNSPYIGDILLGRVHQTVNRGEIIYNSGERL